MVSKIDLGILGLGALAVFLIIRGAGQKLDGLFEGGFGNINVDFPEFPDITNVFNQGGEAVGDALSTLQDQFNKFLEDGLNFGNQGGDSLRVDDGDPFFDDVEPAIPDPLNCPCGTKISQDASGNVTTTCLACQGEGVFEEASADNPLFQQNQGDVIPNDSFVIIPQRDPNEILPDPINPLPNPTFGQIPGSGFVGGGIFETPIENLSLNQIIERFNVTASQARDIQARAGGGSEQFQDDFNNFAFGTNTGSGIGGISSDPAVNTFIGGGNVSNPDFEGLSATEIAQRLTGGIINNF